MIQRSIIRLPLLLVLTLALTASIIQPALASATPTFLVKWGNVTTIFDRHYDWDIHKVADQSRLTLSPGETYAVNYSVTVQVTEMHDGGFHLSGQVHPYNMTAADLVIADVSVWIDGGASLPVTCGWMGETFPIILPAGWVLPCSFSVDLPSGAPGVLYASATLEGGATYYSPALPFAFTAPTSVTDECIEVSDTLAGPLGIVCANQSPKVFNYTHLIGAYGECGYYSVENSASFVTNDSGSTGSATWVVDVNVPCGGCTLTPGYWKTHSSYGPAPYDPTWAGIGENTIFFLSARSWYTVLWTAPKGGNAYYILAHQYIAARLNILAGANTTPAVDATLAWATGFFNTYAPTANLNKTIRGQAIAAAELLDAYNNGYIGPGHCSE